MATKATIILKFTSTDFTWVDPDTWDDVVLAFGGAATAYDGGIVMTLISGEFRIYLSVIEDSVSLTPIIQAIYTSDGTLDSAYDIESATSILWGCAQDAGVLAVFSGFAGTGAIEPYDALFEQQGGDAVFP